MVSKELVLKAESRKDIGSKGAAKLRTAGKIPVIVYGHGKEPESITVSLHEFSEALHHGHRLFDVSIDGKKEKLLVKDLQYDHLGKKIIHADLIRVDLSEKVTVTVGLVFKGTAAGAAEGGIVDEHLDSIEVECVVTNIPESIEVPIKELNIGDTIHAADITLPEGVKLVSDPESLVAACHEPRVAEEAEEEAEGIEESAEPEVIGEKSEEEESEDKE